MKLSNHSRLAQKQHKTKLQEMTMNTLMNWFIIKEQMTDETLQLWKAHAES